MSKGRLLVGLKLRSSDVGATDAVVALRVSGVFDFIELYVVPGTYEKTIGSWMSLSAVCVIHCPHSSHGFNIASRDSANSNLDKFEEVRRFADALKSNIIIVHAGHDGTLDEAVRQLKMMSDRRIHIENKPYRGTKEEMCIGAQPEEIGEILRNSPVGGFALDFGHAVCTANSLDIPLDGVLKDFLSLSPAIFHLSDAPSDATKDVHLNLGKGSLDLKKLISYIPKGGMVTIETPRSASGGLQDFVDDADFLNTLIS